MQLWRTPPGQLHSEPGAVGPDLLTQAASKHKANAKRNSTCATPFLAQSTGNLPSYEGETKRETAVKKFNMHQLLSKAKGDTDDADQNWPGCFRHVARCRRLNKEEVVLILSDPLKFGLVRTEVLPAEGIANGTVYLCSKVCVPGAKICIPLFLPRRVLIDYFCLLSGILSLFVSDCAVAFFIILLLILPASRPADEASPGLQGIRRRGKRRRGAAIPRA